MQKRMTRTVRVEPRPGRFSNATLGMWLFLMIEFLLFVSLFFGYIYLREGSRVWLPPGISLPDRTLATINIGLLLAGCVTHAWAARAIRRDERNGLWWGLVITFLLGFAFMMGQVFEFGNLGFTPSDGAYGSNFYMLRMAHGLHVLGGMVLQLIVLYRAHLGQFNARRHLLVQASALYWYFVALLWIPLFFMLYF
jgi:cytochrome c oxidase subunit 3